jgi:hypothetical protein
VRGFTDAIDALLVKRVHDEWIGPPATTQHNNAHLNVNQPPETFVFGLDFINIFKAAHSIIFVQNCSIQI